MEKFVSSEKSTEDVKNNGNIAGICCNVVKTSELDWELVSK